MGFQLWSKLWSLWSQKRNNQINWNLLLQHPFLTCVLSISSIHFSFFCFSLFGQSDQKQKSAVLLIYFLLISVKTGFEERKKNKQTGQLISYFPSLWPNKEKWIDEIHSTLETISPHCTAAYRPWSEISQLPVPHLSRVNEKWQILSFFLQS